MFTVLFGAGADQDYWDAMPAGNGFTRDLVKDGFFQERKVLLGNEATRYRLIYPGSIKCFIQTIVEHEEEARKYLTTEELDAALWYSRHDADDDKNESVRMEAVRALCKNLYSEVGSNQPSDRGKFILSKALFFDTLDEKFNSLRKSPLDGNGLRVVNAYYTVFLLMMKALYHDSWDRTKMDQKTHDWIFTILKRPYEITSNKDQERSYYRVISETEKCFVATSNYTKLAESVLKSKSNKSREIVYLHGKLTWFEDLEKLIIYDVENELDLDKLKKVADTPTKIIPFILIPSGVKPIICRKQIDEYAKFANMLDQSKKICIMGYGLNSEDNHISAMIAKWLGDSTEHKLIYFNFKGEIDLTEKRWLKQYEIKRTCSAEEMDELLQDDSRVVEVITEGNNSRDLFSRCINLLSAMEV